MLTVSGGGGGGGNLLKPIGSVGGGGGGIPNSEGGTKILITKQLASSNIGRRHVASYHIQISNKIPDNVTKILYHWQESSSDVCANTQD